jgi:Fe-S cluster assembly scaffold protein SufB
MELDAAQTLHANSCLTMGSSTWLSDDECAARLVYIDGRYCPTLSKTSDESSTFTATNVLASSKGECDILTEQHIHALQHVTDGFTEIIPVDQDDITSDNAYDMYNNNEPLELGKLSGVDHRVGKPRSQFALNNQQGTAAFAALNTLKCTNVALVDIPAGVEVNKPILILNAYTTSTSSDKEEAEGVSYHPRLLVMGNRKCAADIVQASVDVDLTPAGEEATAVAPPPRMHNGYTQIYVKGSANITHTYVQENGGMAVPDVEDSDNDVARDAEAQRSAMRDLYLECLDVHVMGCEANFKGNVLAFGGMGRSRVSVGMTLSKKGASGSLNGLMLSGGLQRGDIRTNIHHVAQGCTSRQEQRNMVVSYQVISTVLFCVQTLSHIHTYSAGVSNTILFFFLQGGRSSQTFKGRIRVEQLAQQTDSAQLARTILLTDKARIWAMPSLEIIADDVVCAHGATVSDLSQEELFYLRSRGLDTTMSRNLLMYAFVDEIGREVHPSLLGTEAFGLKKRMIDRLQNLVPKGQRAIMGEFQSV